MIKKDADFVCKGGWEADRHKFIVYAPHGKECKEEKRITKIDKCFNPGGQPHDTKQCEKFCEPKDKDGHDY